MRAGVTAGALVLSLWATGAEAATWIRYSFTGTGTARYVGATPPGTELRAVTFTGQVFVDLDQHVLNPMTGQLWAADGGTSFAGWSMTGGLPYTATAGPGTLGLTMNEGNAASGFQNWTVAALLSGGLGADGRFPVFSAAQPVTGDVAFSVGNFRSSYTGTGRISSLSVARVDAPGSWILSVAPGPVPEPGTWATVLLGFALLGAGLRYRRRSTQVSFN